jgi:hypothetical protein
MKAANNPFQGIMSILKDLKKRAVLVKEGPSPPPINPSDSQQYGILFFFDIKL